MFTSIPTAHVHYCTHFSSCPQRFLFFYYKHSPCGVTSGLPSTSGRHYVLAGCDDSEHSLKTLSSPPPCTPDSCAQNPLLTSASKSLMMSSLFVRRLSRLRNRDMKCGSLTLKSSTKVLHPPKIPRALNSPSFAHDQTTTPMKVEQREPSESAGKNSLSELDAYEIAFTIRLRPDDPSVQWLRQLALDGLSKQLSDSFANMRRSRESVDDFCCHRCLYFESFIEKNFK
ncbi:uncharacterized protein DEA37_0002399 [Paragonimus westermani]|uniref:Uncharacterized protein n=1 Tax=Paragonimus westermani TaxID=34504 RepID=A0A5J4NCZ7_9TREM|nr:uncharacterized protein DEA37_0002399 [Paragonimus westermani]